MKQRLGTLLGLTALAVLYLAKSSSVQEAVEEALALCARSAIPALFPFLVVSSLLIACGFGAWAGPWFSPFMTPLFRLPGAASSALLLGFVGGYPIGAKTAADLYREGLLTHDEASRLLTFCNNSNPVFLITVLGKGVFGSARAGLYLWLIHIASALLTGLLFRGGGEKRSRPPHSPEVRAVSLPAAFVRAVTASAWSCVAICGFITFFYVLSRPFAALGGPLGGALTGLMELFSLTPLLEPTALGFVTASACAGFGGLSVLFQTAAALEGSGLSMRWCATGKAVQGLICAILAGITWGCL